MALLNFLGQLGVVVGSFLYFRWLVSREQNSIGAVAGGTNPNWSWIFLALTIAGVALAVAGFVRGERPWYTALGGLVANLLAPFAAIGLIALIATVVRTLR